MEEKEIKKIYEEMAKLRKFGDFVLFPQPTEPTSKPRFYYNNTVEPEPARQVKNENKG